MKKSSLATIALYSNLCYHLLEMDAQLSLGEYIRRLRRGQKCSLQTVADRTGLSYSHLSRVENDSTVPKADTVARIADALGGDLKLMLELADCLPRQILDRMVGEGDRVGQTALRRSASGDSSLRGTGEEVDPRALALAREVGLPEAEARSTARAIQQLLQLERGRRAAVANLLQSLHGEDDDTEG